LKQKEMNPLPDGADFPLDRYTDSMHIHCGFRPAQDLMGDARSMMKKTVLTLLPLLLLLSLLAGCKTDALLYRMSVAPDPAAISNLDPSGKALTFEGDGIWGALMPIPFVALDRPDQVDDRWTFENPFAGLYSENKEPIAFYLIMENRSKDTISFNPSAAFSLMLEGWPLFQIEYDDLYQALYGTPGSENRLQKMQKMLLRSYVTLQPGEHIRGLLLFKRPEPKKRKDQELTFRIHRILTGKEDVDFLLPLRISMEENTP